MKRISRIIALVLFPALPLAKAGDLTVSARIIDSGHTPSGDGACIIDADVSSTSASPITVVMMNCGWWESWRIEPTDALRIEAWECLKNSPTGYTLGPSERYRFSFAVVPAWPHQKIEGKRFRLGFVWVTSVADYRSRGSTEDATQRRPVILWADPLTVPQIPNKEVPLSHRLEKVPNHTPDPTASAVTPAADAPVAPARGPGSS